MSKLIIILSIIVCFFPILDFIKNDKIKNFLFYSMIISIIIVFSLRGLETTPDTKHYVYSFYNIKSDQLEIQRLETLYKFIVKISFYIFKEFRVYLFAITSFLFYVWLKTTNKFLNYRASVFSTFFFTYGIYYFGITMRQALAYIIAYIGLELIIKNKKQGYIYIIVSSFIHRAMGAYFCICFINKKFKEKTLYIILFLGTLALFFMKNSFMKDFFKKIVELFELRHFLAYFGNVKYSISINTIYYLLFGYIFVYFRKKISENQHIYNIFLNLYLVGVLILCFLKDFLGVNRLADIFIIYFSILLILVFENLKSKINKHFYLLFLILNNFLLFFISYKNLRVFYMNI